MSWYYAQGDTRHGPIEDSAFQALVGAGAIQSDTLVWREGLADWVPYSQVAPAAALSPASTAGGRAALLKRPAAGGVACSQCGQLFPPDNMVSYEGRFICAGCKPGFFQRIKEGASVVGHREYAGFWIRFVAKLVDGIVLGLAGIVIGISLGIVIPNNRSTLEWIANVIGMILQIAYSVFFVGKYGATPGKMLFKLEIVRPDDSPMTYGRATGRFFAEVLNWFTLTIGYIMAAFDDEKRALHDRIADTRVVRKV